MPDPYASGGVHGILLLPNAAAAAQLTAYSRRLGRLAPSLVQLNDSDVLPHLTIGHFTANHDAALALWAEVAGHAPQEITVSAVSLYLRPDTLLWGGLDIAANAQLLDFHRSVTATAAARGITGLTESGDMYWPHITLARWAQVPPELPVYAAPLGPVPMTPVLAVMGEHGVARTIVARLPSVT